MKRFGFYLVMLMVVPVLAADTPGTPSPNPLAEPPPLPKVSVSKLKENVDQLANERKSAIKDASGLDDAADSEKLRAKMIELLKKLGEQPSPTPKAELPMTKKDSTATKPKIDIPSGVSPVDALRMAQNYYKAGEIEASYKSLQLIDPNSITKEDAGFAKYLTACCLKRFGKTSEAMVIFREVAENKDDEFLMECSLWQLSTIRSIQELEAQLEHLRSRKKSR